MTAQQQEEQLEAFVDPQSMTVAIHPGEMVILPVDCEPKAFVDALKAIDGVEAWPLPDNRVAVKRKF